MEQDENPELRPARNLICVHPFDPFDFAQGGPASLAQGRLWFRQYLTPAAHMALSRRRRLSVVNAYFRGAILR